MKPDIAHTGVLLSQGALVYLTLATVTNIFEESPEPGHPRKKKKQPSICLLCEWASEMFWKRLTSLKLSITYVMHLKQDFKACISVGFLVFYNRLKGKPETHGF